jgi:hypothetical protein
MTKVTVRLSPECEAALAEAKALGINSSEFIRAAILSYHSSGSWKTPATFEQVENSISFKEKDTASDTTSDRTSDTPEPPASEARSPGVERVLAGQQLSSSPLPQPPAYPQSSASEWMNFYIFALTALAVLAIVYLAFRIRVEKT